ncbi:MAG: hypothetical protein B7Y40_06005 [Gammaproteobacteria bacterium 28-57-27]|nr:MAG: hypothetical protein B7Y40_06005 [Gammaproteobacteria bacterium 28-57-27]
MSTPFLDFRIIKPAPRMDWHFEVWSNGRRLAHSGVDESYPDMAKAMTAAVRSVQASLRPAPKQDADQ